MNRISTNHIMKIANTFNWYKDLLNIDWLIPNKYISLDMLPIIDHHILNAQYYAKDNLFSDALIYKTSGTTYGVRKNIFYSLKDHMMYISNRKKIFKRFIHSNCNVACSDLGTGHAADSATKIFSDLGLESHQINFNSHIEEHINILNSIKPDVFFTMPMILKKLVNSKKLNFSPKKIFLVGDIATKIWQNEIAEYFKISQDSIIDLFGSIEIGSIAYFNHSLGLYQFEDHIIPEVVNTNEQDILLITSLNRNYFPAIRYKTYDVVKNFSSIIINNKKVWTFEKCEGRQGPDFKLGEKISLYDITSCLDRVIPNVPFNVRENNFSLEILIPNEISSRQIKAMHELLRIINPDVKMMIDSGLVDGIQINRVPLSQIDTSHFKQRILKFT